MNDEHEEIIDRRNASPVSGHDSDPERELQQARIVDSSELDKDSQEEFKDEISPLNQVSVQCSLP